MQLLFPLGKITDNNNNDSNTKMNNTQMNLPSWLMGQQAKPAEHLEKYMTNFDRIGSQLINPIIVGGVRLTPSFIVGSSFFKLQIEWLGKSCHSSQPTSMTKEDFGEISVFLPDKHYCKNRRIRTTGR